MEIQETYDVKIGDTLGEIAARVRGSGVAQILDANPRIGDPNLIFPGERIAIPCVAPTVPTTPSSAGGPFLRRHPPRSRNGLAQPGRTTSTLP